MDATRFLNKERQKGIAIVYLVIILTVFMGMATIVIDLGYLYLTKSQLQNAADAGALAGAGTLHDTSTFPFIRWTSAQSIAKTYVKINRAGGNHITENDIQVVQAGYWNLAQVPVGIQSLSATIPKGKCSVSGSFCTSDPNCPSGQTCLIQDIPAVQVKLTKSNIHSFFAGFMGFSTSQVSASAVAVSGPPVSVPSGETYPFLVSSCVVGDYFSQNPLPNPPTEITNISVYHLKNGSDVYPGQWSSLTYDKSPSANLLKDYINYMINPANGSPSPAIETGDPLWIDPGTKASVYHAAQDLIDAGKGLVLSPIVDCNIQPNTRMAVRGFVAIQLTSTTNKSITGHFVSQYTTFPGTQLGGGPNSNAATPPMLVK